MGIETTRESTFSRMAKLAVSGQSPDTGFYDPEMFERSIATKPYAYLLEPFDVQQTEATIRIALYQRQLELDLPARQTELEKLNRELELRVQEHIDYTTQQALNSVQSELQGWVSSNAANSNGPHPCITLVEPLAKSAQRSRTGAD